MNTFDFEDTGVAPKFAAPPAANTIAYWRNRLANYDPSNYLHNPTPQNFEAWKARNQERLAQEPKTALHQFQEEQDADREAAHAAGFSFESWQLDKQVQAYAKRHNCSYSDAIDRLGIIL